LKSSINKYKISLHKFVEDDNIIIIIINIGINVQKQFKWHNNLNNGYGGIKMMKNSVKKIALLTGGGDCPGLNAVIRAVTRTAILKYGLEVIGYKFGYRGLYKNEFISLDLKTVSGIQHKGGTILYSSNKDNLFDYTVEENGKKVKKDVSDTAIENMKKENVDVLVVIGGDGTLTSARDFSRKGVKVIGVPKTIDNDLAATDITFGFNSALNVATDALDRLHTTAESHHRIMILEVMGRNAGWIALQSGIAGSADVILIPEIPYDINKVVAKVKEREEKGKLFSIIVVAEGAKPKGGNIVVSKIVKDSPDPIRLGGIGNKLAYELEKIIKNHEIRCTVLGHIQRGGTTSTFDRILSTRYGVTAVELINNGRFGNMVCLRGTKMSYVHLENVIGRPKLVDPEGQIVSTARSIGISFGD
jgi:6-phosphofructokinase 1